jgi:multicomponent Na+:H+ antiporter subunit E
MKHSLSLTGVLLGVWLLWSGHFEPLLIGLGAVSILLTVWIARRMRIVDPEGAAQLGPGLLLYLPWLVGEIVKSNLDVARRILDPKLPISPRIIKVPAGQASDLGRVIYANSITLTPGTVSVNTVGGTITVHALTREAAAGVETGEMDRRVTRLEGSR